jgi:hypothetical protein
MNNYYFTFFFHKHQIIVKHVYSLWFSERHEIGCKVYLFFNIAIVIKKMEWRT